MKPFFQGRNGPMDPEYVGVRLPAPDPDSVAELFHENTKLTRYTGMLLGANIEAITHNQRVLEAFEHAAKRYTGYPVVTLPRESAIPITPLAAALAQRKSAREFTAFAPTPLGTLSSLLLYGSGLKANFPTMVANDGAWRSYPSAGALFPLEVYVVAFRVDGLLPGVYHYQVEDHCLEAMGGETEAKRVQDSLLQDDANASAHFAVLLTAVFPRNAVKYGERGYRFVLLEAGHLMQNFYLLANPLQLGWVALGGFYDDEINAALRIDGADEAVVYAALGGSVAAELPLIHG